MLKTALNFKFFFILYKLLITAFYFIKLYSVDPKNNGKNKTADFRNYFKHKV